MLEDLIVNLLLISPIIYVVTRVITQEEIFDPLKVAICKKIEWLGYMLDCFFCTSFWISIAMTYGYYIIKKASISGWRLTTPILFMVVANILHKYIDQQN